MKIKIKQLFDEITKQKVYPLTTFKAVKDPITKKSLAELLLVGEDVGETQDTPTKDADTLGGKYRASDIDKSMTYDEDESTEVVEDVGIVEADRLGGKYTASDIDVIKQDINGLNSSLIDIYVGDDGKLHKVQGGADSVLPFSSGKKVVDLGVGTSFNVSSYAGYNSFTSANFIIEPHDNNVTSYSSYVNQRTVDWRSTVTFTKNYDANTGILTSYLRGIAQFNNPPDGANWVTVSNVTSNVHAYLII